MLVTYIVHLELISCLMTIRLPMLQYQTCSTCYMFTTSVTPVWTCWHPSPRPDKFLSKRKRGKQLRRFWTVPQGKQLLHCTLQARHLKGIARWDTDDNVTKIESSKLSALLSWIGCASNSVAPCGFVELGIKVKAHPVQTGITGLNQRLLGRLVNII